jgi:hypothetical protein
MTLPGLHLDDWRATKDTLHLYSQILGKIRLATTTPRNHWWNAALYVDVRGLTTRRLHHRDTTFEITIDFVDHTLIARDGRTKSFDIGSGMPVADFDARIHAALSELGVDVNIKEEPFGVPTTTPFPHDVEHASWDREAIARFARIIRTLEQRVRQGKHIRRPLEQMIVDRGVHHRPPHRRSGRLVRDRANRVHVTARQARRDEQG